MPVTCDPAKRAATLLARRLDFADAERVFDGGVNTRPDTRRDYGEDRFISVGYLDGRCVVIV